MRDKVEKLVNQLSDPTERYVVRLRYLDLARWEDIGYALFGGNGDYTGFKGHISLKPSGSTATPFGTSMPSSTRSTGAP